MLTVAFSISVLAVMKINVQSLREACFLLKLSAKTDFLTQDYWACRLDPVCDI
jgi:hypothetical protein